MSSKTQASKRLPWWAWILVVVCAVALVAAVLIGSVIDLVVFAWSYVKRKWMKGSTDDE